MNCVDYLLFILISYLLNMSDNLFVLNSNDFRLRVRAIVSEDEYLKNLIMSLNISQLITSQVDSKYSESKANLQRLEQSIKDDITRIIKERVTAHISSEMKTYLDQNTTMQNHLKDHNEKIHEMHKTNEIHLKNELENFVKNLINSIVNDPNYHIVNKAYFDVFQQNANAAIQGLQDNASYLNNQLSKTVDEKLKPVADFETRIRSLKQKVANQSFWQNVNFAVNLTLVGVVGYLFYTRK